MFYNVGLMGRAGVGLAGLGRVENGRLRSHTVGTGVRDGARCAMSRPREGWAAVIDGDTEGANLRTTQAEAVADAQWWRRHPAVTDRRRHGHGGRVEVLHLAECEWTGEMVSAGGAR